jgi:indolepyruvate ferredoxin oxidoreductase
MGHVMRLVAKFKWLRLMPFNPFGFSHERRTERRLIKEYEKTIGELIAGLDHDNHGLAVEIASVPEHIRGFGFVKQRHMINAKHDEATLLERFRSPGDAASAAE